MALTQEQLAKLMGGMKIKERAKVIGVPMADMSKEDKRLINHIDSQNMARHEPIKPDYAKGFVSFGNAPRDIADSGLMGNGLVFDESQLAAQEKLTNGRHVALIGAAGTGKTTMVKYAMGRLIYGGEGVNKPIGIRTLSEGQGPSIAICAFTGIATQVIRDTLPEWLQPACKTIHTLLEYKPADNGGDDERRAMFVPTRNALRKLDHDLIVIDEASMLGLDLWHNLVDALRPGTRIILIGDLNQLKPVADATMFAYALSAGIDEKDGWTLAELTTIHRQKEPEANAIIDAAHAILAGKNPSFQDPMKNPGWRIITSELAPQATSAHKQIVGVVEMLRKMPTPEDPTRMMFDPYKDLLLCAGNGYDENDSASFVQQAPLNESLSRIIEPQTDEHPLYIIDAGRSTKRFAVGHRVMATKNESPDIRDRVTNGLTGRITKIESNANWKGKPGHFGTEKEVLAYRRLSIDAMKEAGKRTNDLGVDFDSFSLAGFDTSDLSAKGKDVEKQSSHVVHIRYNNGAERIYRSASDVESIVLAYAVTTHKAQGSQADTVIVICHHAVKRQLNREWLYTGVTRARKRLIVLSTRMGMAKAIHTQQIFGATLRDKVNRYRSVMEAGNVHVRLKARENVVDWHKTDDGEDGDE